MSHLQPAASHSCPGLWSTCIYQDGPEVLTLQQPVTRFCVVGSASFPCHAAPASAGVGLKGPLLVRKLLPLSAWGRLKYRLSPESTSAAMSEYPGHPWPCKTHSARGTQADKTVSASDLLTDCPLCALQVHYAILVCRSWQQCTLNRLVHMRPRALREAHSLCRYICTSLLAGIPPVRRVLSAGS